MEKTDKRDRVIRAALELIAEHGFHDAPMALIAQKADVAAGTIYRYFENKDVLITELYREVEEKIFSYLQDGYPVEKPIRERFLHLCTALLRYFINYPLDFRYLEQFHNSPYGVDHRRGKILGKKGECDVFRNLFEEGVAQQVMKNLPMTILFALSFGPLITLARDHILGFINLDDALILSTGEACWDGIRR
jgi:AcrR family transcriptional regulator